MAKTLNVCGIVWPMQFNGSYMACCTLPPGHRGDHRCMVDYEWPAGDVVLGHSDPEEQAKIDAAGGARIMSWRIRAPKGKGQHPFIHAAITAKESP